MLRMLLEAGADPNRSGPRGQTPLALAIIHRQDETIDLLLDTGASPDGGSQSSTRPLLFALEVEVAERLLEAGASVDARDTNGGTALMNAAVLGDSKLVDVLLEHGADVNATDLAGRPALLYATVSHYDEIRNRLLAAGASPLPGHDIAREGYASFLGRYGEPGGKQYEIVADPGMLLLIEQGPSGLLYAAELAPLSPTRFYRSNDPGATIFELRIEEGRVTALASMQSSTWEIFPRVDQDAGDRSSAR
jgi:ankyrin repeat protein